jgi:electron transfer flavoprotein alpha subunit
MNITGGVLVLLECSGEQRQAINAGLVAEGQRIAESLDAAVSAVAAGAGADVTETYAELGASTVYLLKNEALSEYRCEVFAHAVAWFVRLGAPRLLLIAHTDRGQELAPRIAFLLDSASVTGCSDIREEGGSLCYVRPVHGGQFAEEVSFAPGPVQVATIQPDALDRKTAPKARAPEIIEVAVEVPPDLAITKHLGIIPPDFRMVDIGFAKRIVGAGAGSADPELLLVVEELAQLLEGSLGTTRPVVDDGHLPKERMIGQTGKTVAPELYLALGISGSPHHVAGIQESRRIIAINRDVRAPIFQFSNVGFIGDLKKVLPRLVERIKEWRDAGG